MELDLKNNTYNFKVKDISYRLTKDFKAKDKIIYTDMGNFRIRKNGRAWVALGTEVIRVTPLKDCI